MVSLRFAARAICERPLSRSPSLHHLVHVLECLYTLCNVSRYRPPIQPGSKYITPEGAKRLRDELHQLWHEERPRVTAAVAEAAAQGDRSENAEYTYGKKRLHEIDRRVRFLRKRLEGMAIVDPSADPGRRDRKSTRLNSSHSSISYAVFCLKKKKKKITQHQTINKNKKNKKNT